MTRIFFNKMRIFKLFCSFLAYFMLKLDESIRIKETSNILSFFLPFRFEFWVQKVFSVFTTWIRRCRSYALLILYIKCTAWNILESYKYFVLKVMTVVPNQANDMMDIGRLQGFEVSSNIIYSFLQIFYKFLNWIDECDEYYFS